jgi:hypothetical protein
VGDSSRLAPVGLTCLHRSDIYFSSILGKRPAQIWPDPVTSLTERGIHMLDAEAEQMLSRLGQGFRSFKLDQNLDQVLNLMCDLVVALVHNVRGGICSPEIADIILQRNAVQNKLLWTKPSKNDTAGTLEMLDNIIRIVANIFSDMVLFPLSPATGIKPRLAAELRRCLKSPVLDIEDYGPPSSIFLWVLTLGGVAASFTRHRGWYVESLAEHYGHLLCDPATLLERMSAFLWWADVCDQPARLLWTQALEVYDEEKAALAEY